MPRFFTSAVQFDEAASVGSAVIDGEDGRHIARSLRMHTGDALTLSDGAGTDYTGEIRKHHGRYRHGCVLPISLKTEASPPCASRCIPVCRRPINWSSSRKKPWSSASRRLCPF